MRKRRLGAPVAVSPDAYAEFLQRLDRPAQPNERLQQTMRAKLPWSPVRRTCCARPSRCGRIT
ncbi:MAG: DUF1778 domain-containing protein [Rhodocyclaceae bacterium]|nr:DUF1778 domain-containing protein [Rhodocyclaceae bacterium]MBX3668088.1 DUF1778 domain-containing protein [Rhodocyclaceae bacterium]